MVLISFSFKNIRYFFKNLVYLYFVSFFLGGALYLLNDHFSYAHEGLVFINNGFSINVLVLLIVSPIMLYFYIKENKHHFRNINKMHQVDVVLEDTTYHFQGYLDTGNQLYDIYKHRPITLLYSSIFAAKEGALLTPFETFNDKGMLSCFKVDALIIDKERIYQNALVGISKKPFKIEGVDCILHNEYMEE